jgi:cell division protein FtsQ
VTTPKSGGAGTPRERSAAAEKAMRRRERREQHMSGSDRTPRTGPRATRSTRTPRSTTSTQTRTRPQTTRQPTRVRREVPAGPPTRRRAIARRWIAVGATVAVLALVAAVLWTPLLGVRSVTVQGASPTLTSAQIESAARVPTGTPMVQLDTGAVATRVHQLPRVGTVRVSREWPGTIRIAVTERDPVGFVVEHDGVHLVDRTGLDYATIEKAPAGLPRITLSTIAPTDQRTRAVVGVLRALPPQLRAIVLTVTAKTPGSVMLGLTGKRTIDWGSADQSARKTEVLAALMTRPGKVYDVSSPELPTIS